MAWQNIFNPSASSFPLCFKALSSFGTAILSGGLERSGKINGLQ
jgi:hypothetical protein